MPQPEPPKIFVTAPFPPDNSPEADHAYHLCLHLADAGWWVDVVTHAGSVVTNHPRVAVHPVMREWSWRELPRWAALLRRCQPDAALLLYMGWIYHHHPMITFAPTVAKRLRPGLRFATLFEGAYGALAYDALTPAVRAGRKMAAQWAGGTGVDYNYGTLLRDSDAVFTLCAEHEAILTQHHPQLADKNIRLPISPLLPIVPDNDDVARARGRAMLKLRDNELLLVYFGYIYPGKGVETLLRAFQLVCAERSDVRLALVGGVLSESFPDHPGDYAERLRALATQLGVSEKLIWTGGFAHGSDFPSLCLRAADVCVLPFDEGAKLNNSSLAAAVAHGLPVITTTHRTPVAAFIDGQNLMLCPPRDPIALATAIRRLSPQPELRVRLRQGALELADQYFSWPQALKVITNAFQRD